MPKYSYLGTAIEIEISDELAAGFNAFQDDFVQAQKKYRETHGKSWTYTDPISLPTMNLEAYNLACDIINAHIQASPVTATEEDVTSDYLVRL